MDNIVAISVVCIILGLYFVYLAYAYEDNKRDFTEPMFVITAFMILVFFGYFCSFLSLEYLFPGKYKYRDKNGDNCISNAGLLMVGSGLQIIWYYAIYRGVSLVFHYL